MSASVYMLRCSDGTYYVGSARGEDAVTRRVSEHQQGIGGDYTSRRLPITLVYECHFDAIVDAIAWERRLKGWNRAKKEALIRDDWVVVSFKAKRPSEQLRLARKVQANGEA